MQVLGRRDALVLVSLAGLFLLSEGFVLPAQPAPGRRLETCMSTQRSSDEAAPARRQQYAWLARAAAVAGAWMAPAVSLHALSGDGMGPVEVRVERMVANAVPRGGLDTLNGWLSSVRDIRSELQSEQEFDAVRKFNDAFDVEKVSSAVDGVLDSAKISDQTLYVEKRKVIDKVLRAVVSDVVNIEDTLRDLPPSKTGPARLKRLEKPLGRLETDLQRLTAALTSDDSAGAAGVAKPLFNLCPDGYLLCD